MLLLSGIGDGAELQKLGIPLVHDLAGVGRNYHDHFAISICMKTENADSYGISLKAVPRGAWNIAEYLLFRAGPLAGNVFESTAFIKTEGGLDRPDIQLVFQPARRNAGTFPIPIGHGYNISVVTLYPKSRGSVTLSSANPHEPPLIDPNLLAVPEDIDPLVRGLKIARRVLQSPAFARYQAEEFLPGPSVQSDEELKEYIRAQAATVHHPSGSCKMGVGDDAVVDPQLKVHGMEGLRVVDASIFPFVMGGNTNAPVVMVAEKGADMILGRPAPAPIVLPEVA
jgi:choline dehydrogenase